jgi:4-hydroxy-tetrahydrodipicolinate reductase
MLGETGGYSPYMVEMHHCHKLDAPSGTARSLADIVDANMDVKTDIQSVRCGEIPGIHTIGFEGLNDRITLTHEAFSREGFAAGAVEAALRTEGLEGVHEFKELLLK